MSSNVLAAGTHNSRIFYNANQKYHNVKLIYLAYALTSLSYLRTQFIIPKTPLSLDTDVTYFQGHIFLTWRININFHLKYIVNVRCLLHCSSVFQYRTSYKLRSHFAISQESRISTIIKYCNNLLNANDEVCLTFLY